jgi:hypothetical protein
MNKSKLSREYRKKYGMDMPTKSLAKVMYKEHPLLFINLEDARAALRRIEGKSGVKNRDETLNKEFFLEGERPKNPYALPKSEEKEYLPYIIEGSQRIAALFDVHAPYHSIEALTAALNFLSDKDITTLLIGGDFFDFYGMSRYAKDPDKRNTAEEIKVGVELLQTIFNELSPEKVVFKYGNHDERFEHYIWQKFAEIPQLTDFEEMKQISLETILRNRLGKDFPIDFVTDKRIIRAGNLSIVHGHEFPSGITSPVNIARGLYLRAKANTICGHSHKSSEHSETDINGQMITTWSVGSLCELHPLYMPINSWNHGVALITLDESGVVDVQNKRIKNGRIV